MKQRFTKLLAAVALLVGLAIPMGMWGQTRVEKNVTYSWNSTSKAFVKETATNDAVDEITPSTTTTGTSQSSAGPNGDKKAAVQLMSPNNGTPRGTFVFTLSDFPYEVKGISFNYYTTSGNKSGTMTATLDGETFAAYSDNISSNSSWSDKDLNVTGSSSGNETLVVSANYTTNSVYVHSLTVTYTANVDPVDPTITFNNGSVYVGQTLNLSTLFTSNSSGAVTYSITSGDSYATLDGSALTGVAVGSVTVKASQVAAGLYNAGEATATIAVTEYVQPTQFDVALNNVAFDCNTGNNGTEQSFTINNTVVAAGCSSSASSKTYYDAGHVRFYAGSYLRITAPAGYHITKTVFTSAGTWYGGITVNAGTYTDDTKTWEGSTNQLEFSFAAQNRISSVAIILAVPGDEYTITYANLTNGSFAESNPTSVNAGVPVTVLTNPDEGFCLATMTFSYGTTTENATVSGNSGTFTMPEHAVTVSATFSALTYTNYQLVSSVSDIVSGKHYIIVGENEGYYAMGEQNTNNRAAVEINVNNGTASVSNIDPVREVIINGPDANGFYIIYDAEYPGYLYAAGGTGDNHLKTQSFNNNKGQWTISIEEGVATVVANASGRNNMRYNSSNNVFSCYTSGSQQSISLYVKDPETEYTYVKDITGYGTDHAVENGWYLIASPVANDFTPSTDNGFITDYYDLYRFNQTAELEWENQEEHQNDFDIESGRGYLYASSTNTTLVFAGTPYNGDGVVELNHSQNADYDGFNLVGNPLATSATINLPFYKMNDGHTALTSKLESGTIAAMEGAFVYAYDETTQQAISSVAFTASRSRGNSNVSVNIDVMHNGANIDNAIVRFDEGRQLPKYQLFKNSTKLYIPKNGKDYAIVNSEAQGEMPVNFKAEENGTYSLNINTENVEMNYLHLVDNMTGMDVDLLQTPSYTFDATTNDYASRFRLVFSANDVDGPSTGSGTFAFYSNGNWVIGNEGEATLQVIDVNGRIVSNETINGSVNKTITATPGVYMFRLVNGNEVKTQKIVVK